MIKSSFWVYMMYAIKRTSYSFHCILFIIIFQSVPVFRPIYPSHISFTFMHPYTFCHYITWVTSYRRCLLRKWVISGHNVHDDLSSRYICIIRLQPINDFPDVYRMDCEIQTTTKGMTPMERKANLSKRLYRPKNDPPDNTELFLPVSKDESKFF